MWNVARISVNIYLSHVLKMQQDRHFLFLFLAHRLVGLQQPDLCVWLLIIVQVPSVSGQCAL